MPAEFVPGIELCAAFHADAVRPLLARHHPGLRYAAALVGPGSDVLGFDTPRSTDHDWGPRLRLFLEPADAHLATDVAELLGRELPATFAGWPTRLRQAADGVWVPATGSGPARHRVLITTPDSWYADQLGFLPRLGVTLLDWLSTPTQLLAEQTAGAVYHDAPGTLSAARAALHWYPGDVWRYLLAAQWQRIAQEEPFVGRCVEAGDELGAALVTARLVRDLSRLRLLQARRYPPYSKWLGSAVARLPGVAEPLLAAVHSTGAAREDALCRAYRQAGVAQNELGLAGQVDPAPRWFHDRPYRVIGAQRFATALHRAITDPNLAGLPLTGAIDQFADSTDLSGLRTACRAATNAVLAR